MEIKRPFIPDALSSSKRHNLNLSSSTWSTLEEDYYSFYPERVAEVSPKLSTIVNAIIQNYSDISDANAQTFYEKKENLFLKELVKNTESKSDTSMIINHLLLEYKKNHTYPKNIPRKITLQVDSLAILKAIGENTDNINNIVYENSRNYLTAIIEDYGKQTRSDREKIIRRDFFDSLEKSIKNKEKIKLTYLSTATNSSFYATPLCIKTDSSKRYNYLIYCELDSNYQPIRDSKTNKLIKSFNISRLTKTLTVSSTATTFTDIENLEIRDALKDINVQFIDKELCIKVKFSDEGLIKYRRISYLRPLFTNIEKDDNGKDIYSFMCTVNHAVFYFSRLGKDAIVIEPKEVKDLLTDYFNEAAKAYNDYPN